MRRKEETMRGRWHPALLAVYALVALAGLLVVGGLAFAGGGGNAVKLKANLSGANEVPPADPDGRGRIKVNLRVAAGQVCFDLRFRTTGTPNRGHIHQGPAGTNGGIVVEFFELVGMPTDPRNDRLERNRLRDCVSASSALLGQIAANPGNYYVNLHNARFPDGAIRGQLQRRGNGDD
jgi:hypothetical protein